MTTTQSHNRGKVRKKPEEKENISTGDSIHTDTEAEDGSSIGISRVTRSVPPLPLPRIRITSNTRVNSPERGIHTNLDLPDDYLPGNISANEQNESSIITPERRNVYLPVYEDQNSPDEIKMTMLLRRYQSNTVNT